MSKCKQMHVFPCVFPVCFWRASGTSVGGILDDVMMATLGQDVIMVVNSSNSTKLIEWFDEVGLEDTKLTNISETHGFIAVQGPESLTELASIFITI